MDNVVSMQNVTKRYDDFIMDNVSFDIPKGYIMGVIGQNGSGKTTLIKLITNLVHPNNGEIKLFGKSYSNCEKEIKEKIGFVYDHPGFYQHETVKQMKEIIAPFYKDWNDETFEKYRKSFHLPEHKKIKELSKGMKMKLSLAFALSHEAELIVMDEPTSGLDPVFRRELLEIFSDIIQNENRTIVLASHITADLDRIADFITYIHDGEIVLSRPKDDLFESLAVVKGPNSLLEGEFKQLLIGMRKSDVGFEALTGDVSQVEKFAGKSRLVIEKPNLEDILFYYSKGEKS